MACTHDQSLNPVPNSTHAHGWIHFHNNLYTLIVMQRSFCHIQSWNQIMFKTSDFELQM